MATNLFTQGSFGSPPTITVQAGVDSVSKKVTSVSVINDAAQSCVITAGPLGNPAQWQQMAFPPNSTTTRSLTNQQSNAIGVVDLSVEPPIGNLYLSAQLVS